MMNNKLSLQRKPENRTNPLVATSNTIKALARNQPEPIIEGLLHKGEQLMVYSAPGAGKSWFALSLAIAAASATAISQDEQGRPKWNAAKTRKVLFLDGELDSADLGQRLKWLDPESCAAKGELLILSRQQQHFQAAFPDLSQEQDAEDLIQFCLDQGVELLVLDNLTTLTQLEDENSASAFNTIIHGLLMRLKAVGIACVLVHHSNKGDGGYRGSSALATTFNAIIHLKKERLTRGAFTLNFQKARNNHIDDKTVRMELREQVDGSLRLTCDETASKLELIAHLVRSRDFTMDHEVAEALARHLNDEPYLKGTFSKWKQQCIALQFITLKEWDQCLEEAAELADDDLAL